MTQPLLEVKNLVVEFSGRRGTLRALNQVSFEIAPGEILGVVGESGAGKSLTGAAITGTCKPAGGDDSPAFTVVVQGAHASWGYDVLFRGQTSHVGFEADILSAAAMKGLLTLGGNKPSPFTAAKS